jgi:CDP-diacylglycerol--serine O-phosphatidyltransferase
MSRMRGPNLRAAVADGDLQFARFLPSALTLLGLCCGATAIRFALSANWKAAVTAIVLAAIFDVLDGGVARLFGADSEFGAQLDSLADLVSFGIAPAMLVYTWTLHYAGGAGWAMALIFCVCCAIRLARFMIESHDEDAPPEPFFVGVPTPAAACLILLPMIVSFQFHDPVFANPVLTMAMIAATSLLMVSRVPTPSLKGIHLTRQTRGPVTAFAGLLLGFAVLWPWSTLTVSLIVYLAGIPAAVAIARDDH